MKITSGKTRSTAHFSIDEVQIRRENIDYSNVHSYLNVLLRPEAQFRSRFQGDSFGPRKYPAVVSIEFREAQEIMEALMTELDACHLVLNENQLLSEVDETKKKMQLKADASASKRKPAK